MAAVNLAMPFINFMFAFSLLLSIGASTLISIHRGAGRTERANELFTMNTAVLSVLALLISACCVFFAKPLAIFLGAGSDTSVSYTHLYRQDRQRKDDAGAASQRAAASDLSLIHIFRFPFSGSLFSYQPRQKAEGMPKDKVMLILWK